MRPHRLVAGFLVACAAGSAGLALGAMVRGASLEETIDASQAIIVGRVIGHRTFRLDDGSILTGVAILVEESLKGNLKPGERVEISTYGGHWSGGHVVTPGEAAYRKGERVLLQLEEIDGRLHTIGLSMGKWNVVEDAMGRRHITRDLSGLGIVGGPRMTEGPIRIEDFRGLVRERTQGR